MAKQLQLNIPTPCHEDWDAMTPVEKGKFCGSCQKQVVDFTSMSDRQVAEFFKKPSTGSVCGRFMNDQLDRAIEIPKKRIPWVKYFFQFALPAFLLSIKSSSAKAQGKVIVKNSSVPVKPTESSSDRIVGDTILMKEVVVNAIANNGIRRTGKVVNNYLAIPKTTNPFINKPVVVDTAKTQCDSSINILDGLVGTVGMIEIKKEDNDRIQGRVVDETGAPVPGASIKIKGTRTSIAADKIGEFKIKVKEGDILLITGAGVEPSEVKVGKNKSIEITVRKMIFSAEVFMGIIISKKTPNKQKTIPLITLPKDTIQNSFKVFPNPVAAGSTINIESKLLKDGDYGLQIVNQAGQSVHQKEIRIDGKAKSFSMDVPTITSGTYFLVLVNKKTGKKYSEKIIIQ